LIPAIFACDIDGTLLDPSGLLRPTVRAGVRELGEAGVRVVLATGRSPWSGVRDLADALRLRGPQVTMQGAVIALTDGTLIRTRRLEPALYLEAVALADELGIDAVVGTATGNRAERLSEHVDFLTGADAEVPVFRYVPALERIMDEGPIRVFLPTGADRFEAVRATVVERLRGRASVTWSDRSGVEVLAPGTNKGEAIAWLAASMGIPMDRVAAVGDARNDLELLAMAGRSAAMGSAPAEVRAAASVTVPSSARDGLLDAIDWCFPGHRRSQGWGSEPTAEAAEAVA
jgi:Cof subfamily protein (haloacid dehalogenase superfamily)